MKKRNTVYSTDGGKHCPGCGEPAAQCRCNQDAAASSDGIVRLQRQTKGRNGKPVVMITSLQLAGSELKTLAKELKNRCGVGGSIEGQDILIQGDKRDVIKPLLEGKGYTVN